MKILFLPNFLLLLLVTIACKPDPKPEPSEPYEKGIFVVNEGIYGQTSGTVTFFNPDSSRLQQDIFRAINGRDLGNVLQSLYFQDDKVYLVVNNSNKIEVANANTFEELAQITGLEQPRYFLPLDANRALVSQWGLNLLSGSIAVVDLETNTVLQKIETQIGKGPEKMLLHAGKVYVANVGGLDYDNFISVIDPTSLLVVDTIKTEDAPNSLQMSSDGILWVACKGKTVFSNYPDIDTIASTYGAILGINPQSGNVLHRIVLQKGKGASDLTKGPDGQTLFFLYDNSIYRLNTATKHWQPIVQGSFYGLGYNAADTYIYASSYSGIQPAWVYRYRAADAVKVDSFLAGVFANSFYFR